MANETSLKELEEELYNIKGKINAIDSKLYGKGRTELICNKTVKEIRRLETQLSDERYELIQKRDKLSSEIRKRKASSCASLSSKALNYGIYMDVSGSTFKRTSTGGFKTLSGITL